LVWGILQDLSLNIFPEGDDPELVERIDRCLGSIDPFVRWTAVRTAHYSGLTLKAREALAANIETLLLRPEAVPWYCVPCWDYGGRDADARLKSAYSVASDRQTLIELIARYKIHSAEPVVEVIANDRDEWDPGTREEARRTLDALRSMRRGETGDGRPGTRPATDGR
jgi:hypothetical protein